METEYLQTRFKVGEESFCCTVEKEHFLAKHFWAIEIMVESPAILEASIKIGDLHTPIQQRVMAGLQENLETGD